MQLITSLISEVDSFKHQKLDDLTLAGCFCSAFVQQFLSVLQTGFVIKREGALRGTIDQVLHSAAAVGHVSDRGAAAAPTGHFSSQNSLFAVLNKQHLVLYVCELA